MSPESLNPVILLVTDDPSLVGRRYPVSLQYGDTTIPLAAGPAGELAEPSVVAGLIDVHDDKDVVADDVAAALEAGLPLLLAAESLAAFRATGDVSLPAGWAPYLPLRRAVDVVAAGRLVADGAIGTRLCCDVTVGVGAADAGDWDNDAPFARSDYEALVFGLDLSEQLLLRELPVTTLSRRTSRGRTAVFTADDDEGAVSNVTVLPVALAGIPSFSAVVTGDSGRLLLRQPFAPGALTVWDAASRSFRCPALRRPKANVQAPDTAPGGRETVEELEALLAGSASDDVRRCAQRLTDQVLAALHVSSRNTAGGEPS